MNSIINGKIYYRDKFIENNVVVFDDKVHNVYTKEEYELLKQLYMSKGYGIREYDADRNRVVGVEDLNLVEGALANIQILKYDDDLLLGFKSGQVYS